MYAPDKLCIRYVSTNICGRMKDHQVRWCTLNKLEIRFQYITNTLQYDGILYHMTKRSQNFVLFFDIS